MAVNKDMFHNFVNASKRLNEKQGCVEWSKRQK